MSYQSTLMKSVLQEDLFLPVKNFEQEEEKAIEFNPKIAMDFKPLNYQDIPIKLQFELHNNIINIEKDSIEGEMQFLEGD